MKYITLLYLFFSLIRPYSCFAEQIILWVEPNGNDGNPGTRVSPLATLAGARDAIRKMKSAGHIIDKGITVNLLPGVYQLKKPVIFTNNDSGDVGKPVIYRAWERGKVVLVGGQKIEGLKQVHNTKIQEKISPELGSHIFYVNLYELNISNFDQLRPVENDHPTTVAPPELFYNGNPMSLAQWPNSDWAIIEKADNLNKDSFIYSGDRPAKWQTLTNGFIYGFWNHDWADSYIPLKHIDKANKKIVVTKNQTFRAGQRWRAINLLEELDSPGEWYFDRTEGLLYIWPPGPLEENEIIISTLTKPLIILDNVSHLYFDGITFEYGRGHGVIIKGGKNNLITNCIIRNLGRYGVSIENGYEHKVTNCELYQLGEGGISLLGGDRTTLVPSNHIAENNEIHHFSRIIKTYHPGIYLRGVGQSAIHNHIHNAPHNAIIFKGNEHLIEFNEINDVALETGDVGVIYTGRDWSARGNIIRYNYIHNTPSRFGKGTMAVYLDDCSSGTLVYGNIFYNAGQNVFIGGGRDNIVENNIFVSSETALHVDSRAQTWAKLKIIGREKGWDLKGKLKSINHNKPPYSIKYPKLAFILMDDPLSPKGNSFVNNIVSDTKSWLDLKEVDEKLIIFKGNKITEDQILNDKNFKEKTIGNMRSIFPQNFKNIPFGDMGLSRN